MTKNIFLPHTLWTWRRDRWRLRGRRWWGHWGWPSRGRLRRGSPELVMRVTQLRLSTYLYHYRQTLAAIHPVVGVARLTLLPLLRPAPALARVWIPELERKRVLIIVKLPAYTNLIILHEALASGPNVRASALTGSVIKLLLERMITISPLETASVLTCLELHSSCWQPQAQLVCTSRLRVAHTSTSLACPGTDVSYMTCTLVLTTLSGMHLHSRDEPRYNNGTLCLTSDRDHQACDRFQRILQAPLDWEQPL